jgi:AraC-like DNA-binding protein
MDIPFREPRLVYLRMQADLQRNAASSYYPELPLPEAIEVSAISNAIFIAEADGTPFTTPALAKHIGIPIKTLRRRLAGLRAKGYVRYIGRQRLGINMTILLEPQHAENLARACKIIIDAAAALSKLEW